MQIQRLSWAGIKVEVGRGRTGSALEFLRRTSPDDLAQLSVVAYFVVYWKWQRNEDYSGL
jgi:hypothetical protein